MSDQAPCHRCKGQPITERIGSYWRARCPNHSSVITTMVAGHTMKTKTAALEEWNKQMGKDLPPIDQEQK
jgi:hypothetical protein